MKHNYFHFDDERSKAQKLEYIKRAKPCGVRNGRNMRRWRDEFLFVREQSALGA